MKLAINNTVLFTSDGCVDKVLVRLSLIEEIIKDPNSICISFSVKHPQTFRESWMSLSNSLRTISDMYTNPFNTQLVIKTSVESHDKKPKDQMNFYILGQLFF